MKRKRRTVKIDISPYAAAIWRIDCSLLLVAAAVLVLVISILWPPVGIIMGAAVSAVYLVLVLYLIPVYVRVHQCELTEHYVFLRNGFFLMRTVRIKYDAIQYCMLSQSILQRLFQVCSVTLMLAGSVSVIRQVSLKDGKRIRAFLERKIPHEVHRQKEPLPGDTEEI